MSDYFKIKGLLYGLIEYESSEEYKLDLLTDIFLGARHELIKSITEEIRGELSDCPDEVSGSEASSILATRQEWRKTPGFLYEESGDADGDKILEG